MDIFLYGLDPHVSQKRLRKYLRPKLEEFGIVELELEKISRGKCALLTLLDRLQGLKFLQHYNHPQRKLFLGKPFSCKAARDAPDPFKIRALETRLRNARKKTEQSDVKEQRPRAENRVFLGSSLACGTWEYSRDELGFNSCYATNAGFELRFGKRMIVIVIRDKNPLGRSHRLDIAYSSIQCIVYRGLHDNNITFTLYSSPRIYLVPGYGEMIVDVDGIDIQVRDRIDRPARNVRVAGTCPAHAAVSGQCFVIQLTLATGEVRAVRTLLSQKPAAPDAVSWPFRQLPQRVAFSTGMEELRALFNHCRFQQLDFSVKFQVQRLAQNGYLSPAIAAALLPAVATVANRSGMDIASQAVQRLFKDIPFAGPESESYYFSPTYLEECLLLHEKEVLRDGSFAFALAKRYPHLVLVHRVRFTPTGMYLEGPDLEPRNHVLRTYAHRAFDFFLRVSFEEEDGNIIRFDYNGSLKAIHYGRFKRILESRVPVAGRQFSFLGFSHSSLRDQGCWYMAPFIHDGVLLTSSGLIKALGDFSSIRCPAKCAARIGQSFTDLNTFIDLPPNAIQSVPDVERNGRVFSDGCSAASQAIIARIWKNLDPMKFKGTVFQIRLGGVKGMMSVDRRLQGDVLQIRPSQEKFPAVKKSLGICGAAKRALPFYLNRPMIKVLEDLGVPISAFHELQTAAVRKLRRITKSPINTADFLQRNDVGIAANLPWLFEQVYYMGLPIFEDRFLWSIIEMTMLINLRELKYRGRIPIESGVTLYGVMDETDSLNEGEVYVSTIGREPPPPGTKVAVTRSPALHPGDIQYATAVSVSEDSPLRELFNCIVFSQRGSRDLPSQLSGGDLDGDMFNIFWEPLMVPKRTVPPAEYPRVSPKEIDGPVEARHITGFMCDFFANDQLSRIASLHLTLADMSPFGVFDPRCLDLASLHSTAVDFSKTGIPADTSHLPRIPRARPDYLSPGPRVRMEEDLTSIEALVLAGDPDEEDPVDALNPDAHETVFYESSKALGVLYRAIDERTFLQEIEGTNARQHSGEPCVLHRIWDWVQERTKLVEWSHLKGWAHIMKEEYENAIIELMCDYSPTPSKPLQEVEVFVGSILGKDGERPTKRVRDYAGTMRDRYDELVRYVIETILRGDDSIRLPTEEALERTLACLSIAIDAEKARTHTTHSLDGNSRRSARRVAHRAELRSWGYLAATLCLRQVEVFCKENGIRL